MITLPVEVYDLIFSQLTQGDKFECLTVCRQWSNIIINSGSLYRFIYIDNVTQFDKFIEKIQREPNLDKKVKRLELNWLYSGVFNNQILNNRFPNLCEFTVYQQRILNFDAEDVKSHPNYPWFEHVKKMIDIGSDLNTKTLLKSGLCKNLSYISVTGENKPAHGLITALANAPFLNTLIIKRYEITIQDMELLHSISSSLNSLSLAQNRLRDSPFPFDITPATLVSNFSVKLFYYYSNGVNMSFYRYLSQKYTHLKELTYCILESAFDEECREIITSHLKKLGPQLETLTIGLAIRSGSNSDNFHFGILDECGCQVKKLNVMLYHKMPLPVQLASTNQVQYIQSLSIDKIDGEADNNTTFEWIRQFKMLKELSLHFVFSDETLTIYLLNLSSFLDNLSGIKLKSLRLHNVALCVNTTSTAPSYPSLKRLSLVGVSLRKNTDVFLSRSFQNLKDVEFKSCTWEENMLSLPDSCLSNLYIITSDSPWKRITYVLLSTAGNNQRLWYTPRNKHINLRFYVCETGNDPSNYIYASSKPYDNSIDVPDLIIECKSVYKFTVVNM